MKVRVFRHPVVLGALTASCAAILLFPAVVGGSGQANATEDYWHRDFTAEQLQHFEQGLEGEYAGIGVELAQGGAGWQQILIQQVFVNSAAEQAGLRSGDVLQQVDHQTVATLDPATVAKRLRGKAGTTVLLTIDRAGVSQEVSLKRKEVQHSAVTVSHRSSGAILLKISYFQDGVTEQIRQVLQQAQAQDPLGVVLDLRENPGGLVREAVGVASAFLEKGVVARSTYLATGEQETYEVIPGFHTDLPLVILTDTQTASAAELLTVALQDRHRAVVVGEYTFGKGSIQRPQLHSDGTAQLDTVALYRSPSGREIDQVGIRPDILVQGSESDAAVPSYVTEVLRGIATGPVAISEQG